MLYAVSVKRKRQRKIRSEFAKKKTKRKGYKLGNRVNNIPQDEDYYDYYVFVASNRV